MWTEIAVDGVPDAGLAHISGLKALKTLWLSGTEITDAGLAHLSGLKALEKLWLGGTYITDAGLAKLQEALPKCRVSAENRRIKE